MSYQTPVPTPSRIAMNTGLSPARPATLRAIFGDFPQLGDDCGSVHNALIKRLLVTQDVGPFRVTGIKPAVESLREVLDEVKVAHPDLWQVLGTAGMMCYRHVRGRSAPSNHASGTAIDLRVAGILPPFNSPTVPSGALVLYGYFHRAGWFWAAGYNGRTDPMHWEVADQTLRAWHKAGRFS